MSNGGTDVPLEVEWQLDALDLRPVVRWLGALPPTPSGLSVTPREARNLVDVYYDTDDWRIGRAGFVLRVRNKGGRHEATMKDTAPAEAGLRRRLEVTETLATADVDDLGDLGPVGRRVSALVGARRLRPVLEIRTNRRPYDLYVSVEAANGSGSGAVGEVALDETELCVGEDEEPARLRRVEVEVRPDWVQTVTPLVQKLREDCGLAPATLSKFEAGLLASGVKIPGPPDLGPTMVDSSTNLGDLAFAVLRKNVSALLEHDPGTRLGEDIEELHDMRVATRRLRAALDLFADCLPVRANHLRSELGWLADVLGAVRDLDVQLDTLTTWTDEMEESERGALGDLSTLLVRERERARLSLLGALDSPRYERLVAGFTAMAEQGPSTRSMTARARAVNVVPDLVRERHRVVMKAERRARRGGDAGDFHKLRIHCKRLRYALEFTSSVYDGGTKAFVRRVVSVQDHLGEMQDAEVAAQRLRTLALSTDSRLSPVTVFAMGGIAERYKRQADRLLRKAPGHLDALRGPEWKKLSALMERQRSESLRPWAAPSFGGVGAATGGEVGAGEAVEAVEAVEARYGGEDGEPEADRSVFSGREQHPCLSRDCDELEDDGDDGSDAWTSPLVGYMQWRHRPSNGTSSESSREGGDSSSGSDSDSRPISDSGPRSDPDLDSEVDESPDSEPSVSSNGEDPRRGPLWRTPFRVSRWQPPGKTGG